MSEFSPAEQRIEAASALATVSQAGSGERYAAYVGLDVHKESIAVAVAVAEPGYRGTGKKGTGVFPPRRKDSRRKDSRPLCQRLGMTQPPRLPFQCRLYPDGRRKASRPLFDSGSPRPSAPEVPVDVEVVLGRLVPGVVGLHSVHA